MAAAFVSPPVKRASHSPSSPPGSAAASDGPSSFSPAFRAYAVALLTSAMAGGAALHRLAPAAFPLPLYLLAAMRDARTRYSAALAACRAMMAGGALLAAGGAALAAGGLRALLWRK
ncbi:hypothetical protein GPECTOR_912g171 [Gonium pectorale]|uniref:Uncharacterized protein n=1 Tax=Gonium pectorale TaxID=33097 RepID=A0A150FTV0_GONPE|nr:hypothetical protein GPECTOR_912g171 [Gonium pectorale]|eukprot:KXZ41042.1 hypothetical protein GPECTOR_912g171 [Gonium pectorale]